MNRKSLLFLFVAIGWQTGIFAQNNPILKYLPDDVSAVVHFDIKRMGGKIPGETFRQSAIYRQMMKDPDMPWNYLFTEPEKSGIDFSAGLILAIKYLGKDRYERNQPVMHLFFKLKDAEAFTKNINKLFWDEEQGKDQGLYQVYGTDRIMSSKGSMTAGWNNDVFVMTSGYSAEMAAEIERYHSYPVADTAVVMSDTLAVVDTAASPAFDFEGMMERFKKSQRELCFQLLTPRSSSSLMSNVHFTNAMNSEADIKFWGTGNGNPLMEKMLPLAGLFDKVEKFSGKNSMALVNFENGKVVAKASNFPEGLVADIYKKYPASVQNMDLAKRLPAGVLMGIANISFNQQMAGELLRESGLLQLLDSLKSKIPFDLGLLPGVFKSNMMIAAVKSDITTTTDETISKMNGLQLVIALPIADKAKFEKLKPIFKEAWDSHNKKEAEEDGGMRLKQPKGLYAKHNDELLVLSLSPQTAEAFLTNKSTGTAPAILQEYSKYPMVVNINLKEILNNMGSNDQPERKRNKGMNEVLVQLFDQVLIYGGGYENGSVNSVFEFRFSDQSKNSLMQLFEMATSMAERDELRMKEEETYIPDNTVTDTAVVIEEVTLVEIKQEEEKLIPPPPPPPPAKIDAPKIEIATFKNAEANAFAKEYAAFILEYISTYRRKDVKKLAALDKKGEAFSQRAESIKSKLTDPKENKKFNDWIEKVTGLVLAVVEGNEMPPPPNEEMKRYTPPVIKKDN